MLSKTLFADTARDRFKLADTFWHNWRVSAIDDFAFVSGQQWLDADEALLREQKRPPITFNYSEKMIDAVVGAEVGARQEVNFKPRNVEDSALSELYNAAGKWVREESNAEDEESDAFRDMLICGLGWTQTRLSYDEDQDGKLLVERVDPLEIRSDPAANKPGLTDRRYAYRRWWVDERDAKREWPTATFGGENSDDSNSGVIIRGSRYEDGSTNDDSERHKGQVQITLYECVEREPIYRVSIDGKIEEVEPAVFSQMQPHFDEAHIPYVKQYKRVYYRGYFAGDTLLEMAPSPCQDGFLFQAITGKRDRNKNTWYGLTRVMKDPQRWANKWLSQILHIINSNAKGGLMAEVNAFVDPQKAQDEWAQPDSITLFKEGALSGNRVQQKQMPPFPSGLDRLMQFALSSLPMVTGINLEALGLANREQAGVLEQQRKQAAYGLLAPLFDALRRYRKNQGRVLLAMMRKFISDGRLVRIGGPESQQFIPLTKIPDDVSYDIIVDASPNAPDVKDRTWEALMQLVPSMLKAGLPLPPDLLDFSPLPTSLVTKWKAFAAQSKQPDPQMQQLQMELQQCQQELAAAKQDQQSQAATLQQKGQQIEAELMLKKQQQDQAIALKRDEATALFQLKQLEQAQMFDLEEKRLAHETSMREQQTNNDFAIKSRVAEDNAAAQSEAAATAAQTPPTAAAPAAPDNSSAVLASIAKLTETLGKPRKLILDNAGKPIGSEITNSFGTSGGENNSEVVASINRLFETLSKPRKLITDAKGKPIGSELVESLSPTPKKET